MTKEINRLPAILLAAIIAAAMAFAAWGALQPTYADDATLGGPQVFVTDSGYGSGVPGQVITLKATLKDVGPEVLANPNLEWRLSENAVENGYAKLDVNPENPLEATLTYGEHPEGKEDPMFSYYAVLTVDDKTFQSDDMQTLLTTQYTVPAYDRSFEEKIGTLAPGESATMNMQVLHFDVEHPEGYAVENVDYTWQYDATDVKVEGKDGNFTVTRLSENESEFSQTTSWKPGKGETWEAGSEQIWYSFQSASYNLEDYWVETSTPDDAWNTIIAEGSSMSKEQLDPRVKMDGVEVSDEYYDLTVEKYLGYNEETGEDIYEPAEFPLTVNDKDAEDLNGNAVGGTAIYRLTAIAKLGSAYKGEAHGYVYLYSDHTLNYFATNVDFGKQFTVIGEWPWLVYEVPFGTTLEPKEIYLGSENHKIPLTVGKDCEVTYVDVFGEEQETFPTEMGVYQVVVRGIGDYYGSDVQDDLNYIKIANKNPMSVTAKALTVKADKKTKKSKKTVFAAKKAFKVTKAKGQKVTYWKSAGNSKITVSRAGKVTVKKGLKKGTYKVTVLVQSDGDSTHLSYEKAVTLKIKVK